MTNEKRYELYILLRDQKNEKRLEYLPKSCDRCKDYSGRATVEVNGLSPFTVSCDSNIAGSGWTVIQRRIDGKVGFYRNWDEYKHGFGDFNREFWIGLQKLHKMTNEKRYELYIHLIDQDNEQRYARYDNFKIGSEDTNFKLISLGTHTGNTRDSMRYHEGEPFSTYDRDNDFSSDNCATILKGGWWYWNCAFSNLNGQNFSCKMEESKQLENIGCIYWQDWHGRSYSMKFVQMMIRPI
ncbi:angiopoietin-related protein 1-like [Drosophila navojoa]|uniref:angiopoietin-related protein 1-like n=1 Tax=Drosophila navojoa TaxID=7232 RepID=UPI0011BFD714|nr:angiopoietin-related protein 1-like [Drosophila navojoa]